MALVNQGGKTSGHDSLMNVFWTSSISLEQCHLVVGRGCTHSPEEVKGRSGTSVNANEYIFPISPSKFKNEEAMRRRKAVLDIGGAGHYLSLLERFVSVNKITELNHRDLQ